MGDDAVSRFEFAELQRRVLMNEQRLDAIDTGGTRGVAVVAVQLQELAKDVSHLERTIEDHSGEHQRLEAARLTARRWAVMALITLIAAIDAPLVTVLLATHH